MQVVILAAGKGTRLSPLTDHLPKALVSVKNKTLIEHVLDRLPPEISHIVIVTHTFEDAIRSHLGSQRNHTPITYIHQPNLHGTADALWCVKSLLESSFLVINGDDLYNTRDLKTLVQYGRGLLYLPIDRPLHASALIENDQFVGLGEGSNIVCGAYVLDQSFFDITPAQTQVHQQIEYGIPQTLAILAKTHPIQAVCATFWQPVGTQEQLVEAQKLFQMSDPRDQTKTPR